GLRLLAVAIGSGHGLSATIAGIVAAQFVATGAIAVAGTIAFRRFPRVPAERLGSERRGGLGLLTPSRHPPPLPSPPPPPPAARARGAGGGGGGGAGRFRRGPAGAAGGRGEGPRAGALDPEAGAGARGGAGCGGAGLRRDPPLYGRCCAAVPDRAAAAAHL